MCAIEAERSRFLHPWREHAHGGVLEQRYALLIPEATLMSSGFILP